MPKKPRPLGYRDIPRDEVGDFQSLLGIDDPNEALRRIRDYGVQRGAPVGVTRFDSPLAQFRDIGRRLGEFSGDYPDVADMWLERVPKDIEARSGRAFDQGYRVHGSRGMSQAEAENLLPLNSPQMLTTERRRQLGIHTDLSPDLIGPAAGYFSENFSDRVPVPLAMNISPQSTLISTDTEVNDPSVLARRMMREDLISKQDAEHVFNSSQLDEHKLMRQILGDQGYTSLIYPNSVEGSPMVGSPQESLNSNLGAVAEHELSKLPFDKRAEHWANIPNPAAVMLDPSDARHLLEAEFNPSNVRRLGYKLGVPGLAALGAYEALKPGEAKAEGLVAGGAKGVPLAKNFKMPPPTQFMGPLPDSEYFDQVSDKADRALTSTFPGLEPIDSKLKSLVDGMGISDLTPYLGEAVWGAEILQRPWERLKESVATPKYVDVPPENVASLAPYMLKGSKPEVIDDKTVRVRLDRLKPIKKLGDETPMDIMMVEGVRKLPSYVKGAAKAGYKKAKTGAKTMKQRLGKLLEDHDVVEVTP